jgi:hypothetical protein
MTDHDDDVKPPAILLDRTARTLDHGLTLYTYSAPAALPDWHRWPLDTFDDRHPTQRPMLFQGGAVVVCRDNDRERVDVEARIALPDWVRLDDVPPGEDRRRLVGGSELSQAIGYLPDALTVALLERLNLPETVAGRPLRATFAADRGWSDTLDVTLRLAPDLNRVRHDKRAAILDATWTLACSVAMRTELLDIFRDLMTLGLTRCAEDSDEEAAREVRIAFDKVLEDSGAYVGPKATDAEADAMRERAKAIRAAADTLERAASTERQAIFSRRWRALTGKEG